MRRTAKTKWPPSFAPSRSGGLTLIEVVASMVLISTLLITTIAGFSRHSRQIRTAQQRIEAVQLLDRQVGQWLAEKTVPLQGEGYLDEPGRFRWRASAKAAPLPAEWQLAIARIEVFAAGDETKQALTSVELVISPESIRGAR